MSNDPFKQLSLSKPILRALSDEGYVEPTEVQTVAIPQLLEGKDLLATAQTGTGKTAAFALPILEKLYRSRRGIRNIGNHSPRHIRALVLTPTRELALQIDESFHAYGRHLGIKTAVLLGGIPQRRQVKALRDHPEVLIATPGRLIDLFEQGLVRLEHVDMLVLDEADRMLDMGFVKDVRKIVSKIPSDRQTMFFSATLSGDIARLASDMLRDPVTVEITPAASISENIKQQVMFVQQLHKQALLTELLNGKGIERALVFTRTKRGAEYVMRLLAARGISAESIHADRNQRERQAALAAFDGGKVRVLVATDIVARGIDVEGISHVINFELPNNPESYVHRIGRTARAGAEGIALSFCDASETALLAGIELMIQHPLEVIEDQPYHSSMIGTMCQRISTQRTSPPGPTMRRKSRSRSRSARRYV
jgi:ATP-dependent RNA helicase RhlE